MIQNYEPEKNIAVFKNVQKCQYDFVKILCFRNWRNPGISSAISVHKRLSIVYNIYAIR